MRIALSKDSRASFLQALLEAEIKFEELRPLPGSIMASATYVDIAQIAAAVTSPVAAAVATVLVKWLNARASRKVILTLKDKSIVHLEGYSAREAKQLLDMTEVATVIDTETPSNESNQALQQTSRGGR